MMNSEFNNENCAKTRILYELFSTVKICIIIPQWTLVHNQPPEVVLYFKGVTGGPSRGPYLMKTERLVQASGGKGR